MKRILTLLAAAATAIACVLSGCSKQDKDDKKDTVDTAPTITWEANPDFEPMYLSNVMDVDLLVTAPEGIAGFTVGIDTSSATIKAVLSLFGISTEFDLINGNESLVSLLEEYGFPAGDDLYGQTEVTVSLSTFIPLLASLGLDSGTELSATLTVTDSIGRSTSKTLTFVQP